MANYKERQPCCISAVKLKYPMVLQEGLRGILTRLEGVEVTVGVTNVNVCNNGKRGWAMNC